MPSGAKLTAHSKAAIDALEGIESSVMAFRVATELGQMTPQVRATLLNRVQTNAMTAKTEVEALLTELGMDDTP
jgi:hypothetical protein